MDSSQDHPSPKAWRLPVLLVLVLAVVIGIRLSRNQNGNPAKPASSALGSSLDDADGSEKIRLQVDFGEGNQTGREYDDVPWKKGMSVGDLLHEVAQKDPTTKYKKTGNGQSAFLTEINGVSSKAGGDSFWLYWVNGKKAEVSMDLYELQPGDQVLWKFAPPD